MKRDSLHKYLTRGMAIISDVIFGIKNRKIVNELIFFLILKVLLFEERRKAE